MTRQIKPLQIVRRRRITGGTALQRPASNRCGVEEKVAGWRGETSIHEGCQLPASGCQPESRGQAPVKLGVIGSWPEAGSRKPEAGSRQLRYDNKSLFNRFAVIATPMSPITNRKATWPAIDQSKIPRVRARISSTPWYSGENRVIT